MAAQSFLAKAGLRLATLGSAANLAFAAPLSEGNYSTAAHTDASRIGMYFDRTPGAEKAAVVVMGTEEFAVGTDHVVITQGSAPGAPADGYVWMTTAGLFYRANGSTVGPLTGGGGTVTSVSVTTANGVSGVVATPTTTPAITITLGAITPSSVAASGAITGSNLIMGTGSPEGVVTAAVGTLFERTDGGTGTTLYVKESGAGNTGWVAVTSGGGGTIGGTIAVNQVAVGSGVDTIAGSSALQWTTTNGLTANRSAAAGNEMFGLGAGNTTLSGTLCTFIGNGAGDATTSGAANTLIGYNAGGAITTAAQITAVGAEALLLGDTGITASTAVGYQALRAATGASNTAVGTRAADALTTSSNVVAIGHNALGTGTTGVSNSVAVGYEALAVCTGANNTAVGSGAGDALTTGNNNTAVGFGALGTATATVDSVAIGYNAMTSATGDQCTAIGYSCGGSASGAFNVFVGHTAGAGITSGAFNTYLGYNTTSGGASSGNTVIGASASVAAGLADCVVLGILSAATASGQFVCGSNLHAVTDVYFGDGVTSNTAPGYVIHGTGGSGTNNAGGALTLAGGISTGSATGASVFIQTSTVGGSGTTPQTLANRGAFDAGAGAGTTGFRVWDVDNNTLERVTVGAADSGGAGFKVLRIPN